MAKLDRITWHGTALVICSTLIFMLILGCVSPPQPPPYVTPNITPNNTQNLTPNSTICNDKDCFVSAAMDCDAINLTTTEDIGVVRYSSSADCVFTKTIVSLNANESREMKNLLQGKSMICRYQKGGFDQRFVTSLIFGMENCQGELRDILGQLVVFT